MNEEYNWEDWYRYTANSNHRTYRIPVGSSPAASQERLRHLLDAYRRDINFDYNSGEIRIPDDYQPMSRDFSTFNYGSQIWFPQITNGYDSDHDYDYDDKTSDDNEEEWL